MNTHKTFISHIEKDYVVISTIGALNKSTSDGFADECFRYIEMGIKKLIIDMAQTEFVSSVGITNIIKIITGMAKNDGKIIFINLTNAIERSFNIVGILKYANYLPSIESVNFQNS